MKTILELRQERKQCIDDGRKLIEKAKAEKRDLNSEEQAEWQKRMDASEELRKRYELLEAQEAAEKSLGEVETRSVRPAGFSEEHEGRSQEKRSRRGTKEYQKTCRSYLRHGHRGLETRGVQADLDKQGGYLMASQQMADFVLQKADNQVVIASMATKFMLDEAVSMGVPTLETDVSDAEWTTEIGEADTDTALEFGKRELHPHPMRKEVKASNKFLRHSVIDPQEYIGERLAYKFGVAKENAYMNGNGNGKPLGLFVATDKGISTSRDAAIGANLAAVTMDKLIDAKYTLRSAYLTESTLAWLFHRTVLATVIKLKSATTGEYYWQPSTQAGQPDRLLDIQVKMSEYAPSGSGTYAGMLGAFKYYYIAEVDDLAIQVVDQLYARTAQTGFIAEIYGDGQPALEDAFVRLKLA